MKSNTKVKIGRSTYLIDDGNKKYIIKYEPTSTGRLLQKISRKLFNGSLPFKNEVYVNKLISTKKLMKFRYPPSVFSHEDRCITYDLIEGKETRKLTLENKKEIVTALIEFSKLSSHYENNGISGFVFRYMENPTIKTTRLVISSSHNIPTKFKALLILINFIIRKKKKATVLLHNDLKCKNILKTKKNEIYFIDFEDVTKEKTMVLIDVVNVLFDYKTCDIDKALLVYFYKSVLISSSTKEELDQMLANNVRVCLLSLVMSTCPNEDSTFQSLKDKQKFLRVILNEKDFSRWWHEL